VGDIDQGWKRVRGKESERESQSSGWRHNSGLPAMAQRAVNTILEARGRETEERTNCSMIRGDVIGGRA